MLLTFLVWVYQVIGLIAVFIAAYAILRGPEYIMLSNFGFDQRNLKRVFGRRIFAQSLFVLTPFALAIFILWACFSITYHWTWFLGDLGFVDREGEWMSYRMFIATLSSIPASFLVLWLWRRCVESVKFRAGAEEIAPLELLSQTINGQS